jgi:hypothetical protein
MIRMVHVFPSRMPPASATLKPVCHMRPVAWSAGTMPMIAAANTLSATAYKTASGESRNDIQKGSSEAMGCMAAAT